jgi:predicted ATPase
VEAIETLHPDRLIEQVERLAHHAARGEVWGKALTYLRQAGAKADARSALGEAVSYFEQALTVLGHLPESRETHEQAIDLHFNLLHRWRRSGKARGFLNTCAQPKPWQML